MTNAPPVVLSFLNYSLDPANAQLRQDEAVISLRPKTLAVLHYLAARSGRLVTKGELLDAVWPDTAVTESTLTSSIKELRRALDDDPRRPRIIETAHKRGYRFIAEVQTKAAEQFAATVLSEPTPLAANRLTANSLPLVGRAAELAALDSWLARVLARERQVGFIVGEAGIGKTTLVDAFRSALRANGVLVAHGQCLEYHGAGEPYLPVLEGLERLCAAPEGAPLLALLRRHAPTWLAQLTGLLNAEEVEALRRHLAGTTRERMLREMASLVVALPAPLVLILEDLHWSDNATIDLVAALAQRRDPASLLVIGTYRAADALIAEHPIRNVHQELRSRGRCHDLWLPSLSEQAVVDYLRARWPDLAEAEPLGRAICQRTDGNPLFVVNVVDYLAGANVIAETDGHSALTVDVATVEVGVPQGVRQLITAQIDRLDDAGRDVLEAGCMIGRTFSAAVVAAALGAEIVEVEARLERLARSGQLVRAAGAGVWPDGTVAGRYELIHSRYQHVLADRVPPARRRQLHERIASRLESGYGAMSKEIASELAYHLEAGGQPERAVPHLEEAAVRAVLRGASREAATLLERGLAVLDGLPRTSERTLRTIRLCLALGVALQPQIGPADTEVERAFERARALSEEAGELPQLFQALGALSAVYLAQARFDRAQDTTAQLAALTRHLPFPALIAMSHLFNGMVTFHSGDLAKARESLARAQALDVVVEPVNPTTLDVLRLNYQAITMLHLGYPDQARTHSREAATRAATLGTPFDRAQTAMMSCYLASFVRDGDALQRAVDEAEVVADDYGFPLVKAVATVARGRIRVVRGDHDGGLVAIRAGLDAYRVRRQAVALPTLLAFLAEAECAAGHSEQALGLVGEARALIESTGEVRFAAELARLEGEVRRQLGDGDAAAECFRQALATAARQGARWWELRAGVSYARLRREQGKRADARRALARVVPSFIEGFDTPDVREAQQLLAELS